MKKVIIIGAGPAGITAANELLKDTKGEYDVTILEETERIGGTLQRQPYGHRRSPLFLKERRGNELVERAYACTGQAVF